MKNMKKIENKEIKEVLKKDPFVQKLMKEISWSRFVKKMEKRGWTIA